MQIDCLFNQKQFIPAIVDYLWEEWAHDYKTLNTDFTTKQSLLDFYNFLGTPDKIPTAFVLFKDDQFISTCLIDKDDMGIGGTNPIFTHSAPWLANVFTHPQFRNNGYAKILLDHVIPKYPTLYLWTFNQKLADYYKQFGFQEKQTIAKHGHLIDIIIMQLGE